MELLCGGGILSRCHLAATSWVLPTVQQVEPCSLPSPPLGYGQVDGLDTSGQRRQCTEALGCVWALGAECSQTGSLGTSGMVERMIPSEEMDPAALFANLQMCVCCG